MSENTQRYCANCKDEIHGRSDKRYCSDYCRNTFHNGQNKDASNYIRKVNNILRKNRRILAKHNPRGKSKVRGTLLLEDGFNFGYFTNVYETKKGGKYFFCYDQGYIKLEDDWYALVIRESYVK